MKNNNDIKMEAPKTQKASDEAIKKYGVDLNHLKDDCITTPLYKNFVYKGKIIGFYAKSGQGKTNLVLGLCSDLLKQRKIQRVLYFNADNGLDTFNEREVYKFGSNFNLLNFTNIEKKEIEITLIKLCNDDLSDTLIVLDSLQDCVNGDISLATIMKPFMKLLMQLRDKAKATIFFLCHTTKSSDKENAEEFHGHSTIKNNSDAFYYVDRVDNTENFSSLLKYHLKTKKTRNRIESQVLTISIPQYEVNFLNDDIEAMLDNEMLYYFRSLVETLMEQNEPINQGELVEKWLKRIDKTLARNEKIRKFGLKKAIDTLHLFAEKDDRFKLTKGDKNANFYSFKR